MRKDIDQIDWDQILLSLNLHQVEIRDQRYDFVIHLTTAANGAEGFYSSQNNSVRKEDTEEARRLDSRGLEAWSGHPYVFIIDNSTGFEAKLKRVVSTVLGQLGLEDLKGAGRVKRKFILTRIPNLENWNIKYTDFDVEHHYLVSPAEGTVIRIRKRGIDGQFAFTMTMIKEKTEVRRVLSPKEYRVYKNSLYFILDSSYTSRSKQMSNPKEA